MSELRSAVDELRSEVLAGLPGSRIEEDFAELHRVVELLEAERLRRLDGQAVFRRPDGSMLLEDRAPPDAPRACLNLDAPAPTGWGRGSPAREAPTRGGTHEAERGRRVMDVRL